MSSRQKKSSKNIPDTVPGVQDTEIVETITEQMEGDTMDVPQQGTSTQGYNIDPELDARLSELIAWKIQEQQQLASDGNRPIHDMSESGLEDNISVRSTGPGLVCVPTKKQARNTKGLSGDTSLSEAGLSEGDRYKRTKVVSTKVKKNKKKSKKRKVSSASSSSESSFPSSDSETIATGVMEKHLAKASKKRKIERNNSVRVRSLLRSALEGHFATFKPVETITRGAEIYTGVKGVEDSFLKEMDKEVLMNDVMKRYEHSMFVMQSATLSALAAIVPVANRMANEDKFTTLAKGMNDGIELLAAASTFASYRRFENIYKGVSTEAGKEVTRSKKVKDKTGKEYTLFLPPKPLKGKPWDKSLMKVAESSSKCGRQMGLKTKAEEPFNCFKRPRFDTRSRRGGFRGGRGAPYFQSNQSFRGRGQRGALGWNEYNRQAFRGASAQGRQTGFQRGGAK